MKLRSLCIILWFFFAVVESENAQRSPRVIIVGAGAAGIAAAAKLIENNKTNVIILEAGGRIGGRIYSFKFGDAMIDLGAQWVYGMKENLVYDMVKDYDLLERDPATATSYYSSHNYLDPSFVSELYNIFYNLYFGQRDVDGEVSVGEYVIQRYNKTVSEKYKGHELKLRLAREILDLFLKSSLLSDGAFSWHDASIKRDQKVYEDSFNFNWKERGFKTVLDVLTKKYPNPTNRLPIDDKLLLNKEVTKIRWKINSESTLGVIVECSDGSTYAADHAILTMSLGVLKNRHTTMFSPRLPLKKQKAIKSIGMGSVLKVFLYFPTRWWPEQNFTDFSFVWNETDRKILMRKPWLFNLIGVDVVKHNPNVLLAWFCGESVPKIELMPDQVVAEGIMLVLQKFVGYMIENMTNPIDMIRHNWYADDNFRGSYSFQTVKSRKYGVSQEMVLGDPISTRDNGKPILMFAGEATHPTHYGTVHGAIETGHREAARIIDFYKSHN